MTANKPSTPLDWSDPDDAPDLSTPDMQARLASTKVNRGRPRLASPKIATTIRLDADVLARLRAEGPGWQSRLNAILRDWMLRSA